MSKKPTGRRQWVWAPKKPKAVPAFLRDVVDAKGKELVEKRLKPEHLLPPPEKPQLNYIVDITSKWRGIRYYFIATYACPRPESTTPSFDIGFARLEYTANGNFNVAYMRHTDKWQEFAFDIPIEEALEMVATDPLLAP